MILDVGCGAFPKGDVNVDLFTGATIHTGRIINPQTIPNFVKGDCNHLPFRDNCFTGSICSHVLEHHGVNPRKTIFEMVRVTNGTVRIIVPHWFIEKRKRRNIHARSFSLKTLHQLLRSMELVFEIKTTYRGFPHWVFSILRLPVELEATIRTFK